MPRQTAASIFIESALGGEAMTPFKHTQHRPMLYVDVQDACRAFDLFARKILNQGFSREESPSVVNLIAPPPVTIIEFAQTIQKKVIELTHGKIRPKIKVIDKGIECIYAPREKRLFRIDVSKVREFLGIGKLVTPYESVERILQRLSKVRKKQATNS